MSKPPPEVEPEIVRGDITQEQLDAYLAGDALAVDTETMGLIPMRDRLCLVQLCNRAGRGTLVQIPRRPGPISTPATGNPAPRLKTLLESEKVTKVFHFARFDVAALSHNLAIAVRPLYCTRTASKLVRTYTDRHGLKDNLLELLDVEMDKTARHTDWSMATLGPDQVRYAISDVTTLLAMKAKLDDMLARQGRAELARQCFGVIPVMARLDLLGFDLLFEH